MNYKLVEYTVQLDEYGDRSQTAAVSKSKPALAEYCQTKYGKWITMILLQIIMVTALTIAFKNNEFEN